MAGLRRVADGGGGGRLARRRPSGSNAASAVVRMICFFMVRFGYGSLKGNRREDDLLRRIGDAQRRTRLRVAPLHRLAGVVADPPERTLRLVRRENETFVVLAINDLASAAEGCKPLRWRRTEDVLDFARRSARWRRLGEEIRARARRARTRPSGRARATTRVACRDAGAGERPAVGVGRRVAARARSMRAKSSSPRPAPGAAFFNSASSSEKSFMGLQSFLERAERVAIARGGGVLRDFQDASRSRRR